MLVKPRVAALWRLPWEWKTIDSSTARRLRRLCGVEASGVALDESQLRFLPNVAEAATLGFTDVARLGHKQLAVSPPPSYYRPSHTTIGENHEYTSEESRTDS